MAALGAWVTSVVNLAGAAFALPLLAVAGLMTGIAFATGNPDAGKRIGAAGLIGVGIILSISQIVASIPKPGGA